MKTTNFKLAICGGTLSLALCGVFCQCMLHFQWNVRK